MLNIANHGSVSNSLFDVTDWFPTILDFADCGAKGEKPLDGFSQKDFLWNGQNSESPRDEILQGMDRFNNVSSDQIGRNEYNVLDGRDFTERIHAALRWNQWKLITGPRATEYQKDKFVILYDIESDPIEANELSDLFPEVVNIMLTKLADYYDEAIPPRYPKDDPARNPKFNNNVFGPWIESAI